MAIKRPTKSRGAPSRKPVASVAVRHVDLKSKPQMTPGSLYVGWLCKNRACGAVIAIALPPAGAEVTGPELDDQLTAIKCPIVGMKTCIAGARGVSTSTRRKPPAPHLEPAIALLPVAGRGAPLRDCSPLRNCRAQAPAPNRRPSIGRREVAQPVGGKDFLRRPERKRRELPTHAVARAGH